MRYLLTATYLVLFQFAGAQTLDGWVVDAQSDARIWGAKLYLGQRVVTSDHEGQFSLTAVQLGDSLRITAAGYETLQLVITDLSRPFVVQLTRLPIRLEDVIVDRPRAITVDTVSWRRAMDRRLAKQLRRERQKDIFIDRTKSPVAGYWPSHQASSSSASIVTLNVSKLIGLLAKKKAKPATEQSWSEDQQILIDKFFNPTFVKQLTGLSGETLTVFLQMFRPTYGDLVEVSEYAIVSYIKKSFYEFQSSQQEP